MKRTLAALRSRLLIIPLAGIVFAGALGAGFQWGAPSENRFVRIYDGRVGGDGAPAADIAGYMTQREADAITVRQGDSEVRIRFAPDAVIELLEPISALETGLGDWVVIGAEDDNVNTFVLKGIVVIPAETAITGAEVSALAAASE